MCDGLAVVDEEPSPKSQVREASVPSGSDDSAELNATVNGSLPVVGVPEATAVGAWFGLTVMLTVAVLVAPLLSVTVSVAVRGPEVVYVWLGLVRAEPVPSPKSHA